MWRYHSNYTVWGVRALIVALISLMRVNIKKDVKKRYIDYHNLRNEGKINTQVTVKVFEPLIQPSPLFPRLTNEEQNYSFSRG